MKVVVTGAHGFIGRNLRLRLSEIEGLEAIAVTRETTPDQLRAALADADALIHLAGVNRPQDPAEFATGNADQTAALIEALGDRSLPVIYASSTQAEADNPYGVSKRAAEDHLRAWSQATGAPLALYRLPNVFGKWARPNYNSAVATFCHNIARDVPITVNDPAAPLTLVYVDDVIDAWIDWLKAPVAVEGFATVPVVYQTTVGEVADRIRAFRTVRDTHVISGVGVGLTRALYATYVSDLPTTDFAYPLVRHSDPRGEFVEMLKTETSGQFSYFTAHPGITRGGHYHHTKTEKFLVLKGTARFRFRHMETGESYAIDTAGGEPVVVETIPGWAHDITNIGDDEMIVMLWANEIFDRARPDTIANGLTG
ncbi:MAG: UDP-2-acetamido-2,6-beta-L-arabino-hexul-4-ose reductase [Brevundimonas sp.]